MADKKKKTPKSPQAAQNRKARFNYEILENFEAGIVLQGSEVKSLRAGQANIQDAYAAEKNGELWLMNAYIPEYEKASHFSHETRRPRKLLLHKREIEKLIGKLKTKGLTIVPLAIYFTRRGRAKVDLALGRGKTQYDQRKAIKKREWERERSAALKE